ncbi:PdaC/SigV domain-containing protein [Glacieibacterium sp.]|uniref:DUF3298 and DUF4163 domain-containing protein n=1 Tax=Glacieibacterium sp. TaxID=2860237 RepID=UPI003B008444
MRFLIALALATLAVPANAVPIPASALFQNLVSPTLVYRWRVAPEAALEPALLRSLRTAAAAERAKALKAATTDAAAAKKGGYGFSRYRLVTDWRLAADTPRLLALIGTTSTFSGGAHGNVTYDVRLWDKTVHRPVKLLALFGNWAKARKNIEADYCKALAVEQARRRHGTTPAGGFDTCPRLSDQAMTPVGDAGDAAPSVTVLLPPYAAGPYSEGAYEITLPWPDAIKSLVLPAWRTTFFPSD